MRKSSLLICFLLRSHLRFGVIDILGPLTSSKGYKYILVVTYQLFKLRRTMPLKLIKEIKVEKAFFHHWLQCFDEPSSILADDGVYFPSKL